MWACNGKYSNGSGHKILMVYTLHKLDVEYIPYSVPSPCNNYRTIIIMEEAHIYNFDLSLLCTPLNSVFSHKCTTNNHPDASLLYLTPHLMEVPMEKLIVVPNDVGTWSERTTRNNCLLLILGHAKYIYLTYIRSHRKQLRVNIGTHAIITATTNFFYVRRRDGDDWKWGSVGCWFPCFSLVC